MAGKPGEEDGFTNIVNKNAAGKDVYGHTKKLKIVEGGNQGGEAPDSGEQSPTATSRRSFLKRGAAIIAGTSPLIRAVAAFVAAGLAYAAKIVLDGKQVVFDLDKEIADGKLRSDDSNQFSSDAKIHKAQQAYYVELKHSIDGTKFTSTNDNAIYSLTTSLSNLLNDTEKYSGGPLLTDEQKGIIIAKAMAYTLSFSEEKKDSLDKQAIVQSLIQSLDQSISAYNIRFSYDARPDNHPKIPTFARPSMDIVQLARQGLDKKGTKEDVIPASDYVADGLESFIKSPPPHKSGDIGRN